MMRLTAVTTLVLLSSSCWAQAPGGRSFRPAIDVALDTDKDGKISAKEIAGATAALLKLDKNGDGKLSAAEIGWPPQGLSGFGGRGGPGRGGPGRGGPGRGGPGRGGPGRGGPGGPSFGGRGGFGGFGGGRAAKPRRPDPDAEARKLRQFFKYENIKALDRNRDGKIVEKEVPSGLRKLILAKLDRNKDKVIDQQELNILRTNKK